MGDLMRNVWGESRTSPGFSGGVRDLGPLTPAPGSPYMVSRAPPTHRLGRERLGMRLSIITRREEDLVIAGAKRHELQTPKHHDGPKVKWVKSIRHPGFS